MGDPEGFRNASGAYIGYLQFNGIPNAVQIRMHAVKAAADNYIDLMGRRDAKIGRLTEEVTVLLQNGAKADTPEVASKIAQIHALYAQMRTNPEVYGPENIDGELRVKDLQFGV